MKKQTYESIVKKTGDKILERKTCKQCTAEFPITQQENELIEKIAPVIGEQKQSFDTPDLCPDCRARHRLVRRNEGNFYNSKSSMSGKKIFSLLSENSKMPVVTLEEFWTDNFESKLVGQDIVYDKSILSQFGELRSKIPTQSTMNIDNENCYYTTSNGYCKNCYLINSSENSEDCMYGKLFQTCKNCLDCSYIYDSEKLYQCINVKNGYNSMRLNNSQDSSFCYFSDDLIGCKNCMFCSGLRNAQYCFENKQLTKQDWEEKRKDYLGSNNIDKALIIFDRLKRNKTYKYANIINAENCIGDFQTDNKDCLFGYDINNSKSCFYAQTIVDANDLVDVNNVYLSEGKAYNCLGFMHSYNIFFSLYIFDSHDILLSQECYNSNNLFGCIGLRNKEYCIFNKQYSKEQYEEIVPKLISKMKQNGERNFFDPKHSHYPYNDSLAMEYYPVKQVKNNTTGEIRIIDKDGFGTVLILNPNDEISDAYLDLGGEYKMPIKWKTQEKEINIPEGIKLYSGEESKKLTEQEILSSAFLCEESKRPFRILKQELEFYKQMNLPLPTKHPNIRYKNRLSQKPKRNLYIKNCSKCGIELITVYGKDDSKVLCDSCYNKAIY